MSRMTDGSFSGENNSQQKLKHLPAKLLHYRTSAPTHTSFVFIPLPLATGDVIMYVTGSCSAGKRLRADHPSGLDLLLMSRTWGGWDCILHKTASSSVIKQHSIQSFN